MDKNLTFRIVCVIKIIIFVQVLSQKPHYSKSKIVQKFNFDKTTTFSRVFHQQNFLTIFLVKSKLSTAKKFKTTTFSRVFHPQKIDNFLKKSKLNFWTKNEDFEQCAYLEVLWETISRWPCNGMYLVLDRFLECIPLDSGIGRWFLSRTDLSRKRVEPVVCLSRCQ